jgi:hypothetical protein
LAEAGTEAVTDRISLADQIAYARKVLDRTGARAAVAIIDTLEWLAENEAKIKAKIAEPPPQLPEKPSERVYTQKVRCFLDKSRGGWEHHYEIYDDTGAFIGMKYVAAETSRATPETTFVPFGSLSFDNAAEFIAAYERGEWKARENVPA